MALTRDFKETIKARVQRDPTFRRELLREGVETMLNGDVETGKTVLRDYINATVGFGELAEVTYRSPKSLIRMLGSKVIPRHRISLKSYPICSVMKVFGSSYARRRPGKRSWKQGSAEVGAAHLPQWHFESQSQSVRCTAMRNDR